MAMSGSVGLWLLAAALVAGGLAGSVLPALPGVPLVFAGLVVGAWADDFQRVTWLTLTLLGLLTIASFAIDFAATALGAKRVGATRLAIVGALIGTFGGIFLGIPGLILGPFVGAVAGELLSHGKMEQATRAGFATWMGLIFGTLAKLALVFTMLGVFAAAYYF
jgi:uncharacterized protein YqgC (DUF456 family)